METAKKLEMFAELDAKYEDALASNEKAKVQDVIRDNLDELSAKYGEDPVEIFIAYMDHVAIASRKLGKSNGDEQQINIDFDNLDNIKL